MATIISKNYLPLDFSTTLIPLNPSLPSSLRATIETLAQNHTNSEPLVWIMSSGTSASQQSSFKLIGISHKSLLASAQSVNNHLQTEPGDVWVNVLPLFHVGGLSILYRSSLAKIPCHNLWDETYKWNPQHFVETCTAVKATLSSLVPTQVFDLIHGNYQAPKTLRAIVVGGAKLNHELYQKALKLSWPLLPSFGMTELGSQIATGTLHCLSKNLNSSRVANTFDFIQPELYLLEHHQVKCNDLNQLSIKSSSLMEGYYPIIDGHPRNWVNPIDSEGWYSTPDCAEIKLDTEINKLYLNILGRSDDVVKVFGENVNLATLRNRLESLIETHFAKEFSATKNEALASNSTPLECTIIPVAHERQGHELLLVGNAPFQLLESIAQQFNLKALPFERLRAHPKKVHIPRTSLGKIQTNLLSQQIDSNSL